MAPAGRSSHSGTEGSNPASSVSVAENGDSTDADLVQGRAMLGGGVRIVFDAGDPRLDLGDGNIVGGVGIAARHVAVLARLGAGEDGPEFILILAVHPLQVSILFNRMTDRCKPAVYDKAL